MDQAMLEAETFAIWRTWLSYNLNPKCPVVKYNNTLPAPFDDFISLLPTRAHIVMLLQLKKTTIKIPEKQNSHTIYRL